MQLHFLKSTVNLLAKVNHDRKEEKNFFSNQYVTVELVAVKIVLRKLQQKKKTVFDTVMTSTKVSLHVL